MKKIEKEFLEDYSNSIKSDENFNDIKNHIDFNKYKKSKNNQFNTRKLAVLASSLATFLVVCITIPIAINNNEPLDKTSDSSNSIEGVLPSVPEDNITVPEFNPQDSSVPISDDNNTPEILPGEGQKPTTFNDVKLHNAANISYNDSENVNKAEYKEFINNLEKFSSSLIFNYSLETSENFVISPLSLYFPLAINIACANNNTKQQILNALNMSEQQVINYSKSLFASIISGSSTHQVSLDNSIWIDNNTQINDNCLKQLANEFYTSSFYLDIKEDNETANKLINEYVKYATNDLLDLNNLLSIDTMVAIMNTLYFKDRWETEKEKLLTVLNESFINIDNTISKTDFLRTEYIEGNIKTFDKYSHFYTLTDNGYKFKFIVPNENYTINDIDLNEAILNINSIDNYYEFDDENNYYLTNCYFPKFKIESEIHFKELLSKKYLINDLFTSQCDFSNLTNSEVFVNNIKQNCIIDVNEYGIEAASVTIEEVVEEGIGDNIIFQTFVVNKSFAYVLTSPDDIILFSGIIYNL